MLKIHFVADFKRRLFYIYLFMKKKFFAQGQWNVCVEMQQICTIPFCFINP